MEYTTDMFKPVAKDIESAEAIVRPSVTYWQDAWRRLKQNRLAMVGLWVIVVIALIAAFGPMLSPLLLGSELVRSEHLHYQRTLAGH